MCTPMAAVMAASSVAQYAGQASATDAYNANAEAAHRDANIAAANKYTDLGRKYYFDNQSLNQEGYKAALKGRSEAGTLAASAGSSGIAGGSITLENIANAGKQAAAENEARIQNKRDDSFMAFKGTGESIRSEAQQRINATPFKEGPNPLGLAISLAGAGLTGGAGMAGINVNAPFSEFSSKLFGS